MGEEGFPADSDLKHLATTVLSAVISDFMFFVS